jgi:hypothetical protein
MYVSGYSSVTEKSVSYTTTFLAGSCKLSDAWLTIVGSWARLMERSGCKSTSSLSFWMVSCA